MLYVNVYLVTQLYGGPEEGGWYYDAGDPIGSIPIPTKNENQSYYLTSDTTGHGRNKKVEKVTVHLRECYDCKGTGQYEEESDDNAPGEEPLVRTVRCKSCGEIPKDLEATGKMMVELYARFEDLPGRYEHIQVMLQDHFAAPYPNRKPHYE